MIQDDMSNFGQHFHFFNQAETKAKMKLYLAHSSGVNGLVFFRNETGIESCRYRGEESLSDVSESVC